MLLPATIGHGGGGSGEGGGNGDGSGDGDGGRDGAAGKGTREQSYVFAAFTHRMPVHSQRDTMFGAPSVVT